MIKENDLRERFYFDREAIVDLFANEVYGKVPPAPICMSCDEKLIEGRDYFGGHAYLYEIILNCKLENEANFSFPFKLCIPQVTGKYKTIVLVNFKPDVPDKYYPAEEIIDKGWACASLNYQSITSDTPTPDGLAEIYSPNGEVGKITLWTWAAMRIMDYLHTRDDIDINNIGVVGHSRLGKTALWTGANDVRFRFIHSNDSGTVGAALFRERNEKSESIGDICRRFPYWFNKKFPSYIDKETVMDFDQDMLIGAIAPRIVSIGSASNDLWANPHAEMLSAKAASSFWEAYGEPGLIDLPDEPEVGVNYHKGRLGYYVREGGHFLSRNDWGRFLDFFEKNII